MSGLSKLFNRPRKSQSTPTKTFGCLPTKLSSSIPLNKRNSSPPTSIPPPSQQEQLEQQYLHPHHHHHKQQQQQQQQQQLQQLQYQQYPHYTMNDLDFAPRPVQDVTISTNAEDIKPIKKKRSHHTPLTVRNPTPDDFFNMIHSLADTPSREQVTRYTLVDNKPSAPMRKPTPFARTRSSTSSSAYVTQSTEDEEVMTNQAMGDYNRENKQKHGKTFSTKSEFERMKQQLEDIQKERAEFKQQEKRHKRREKRMHQQILETREQLDSLMLSRSYEERTISREYSDRPMLTKRNSIASTNYFQQFHQHQHQHHHPHYQYSYWYNDPSYQSHQHPHSYTSPSTASGYFPPATLYHRYGSSLDNVYLVDHENSPSHYSQSNTWNQKQQHRSSYQPRSYF